MKSCHSSAAKLNSIYKIKKVYSNWTPGIFQIADMVAKNHDFHATFNVHGGFSNINLDVGPLRPVSRETLRTSVILFFYFPLPSESEL